MLTSVDERTRSTAHCEELLLVEPMRFNAGVDRSPTARRILLVDDDEALCRALTRLLERAGYLVAAAHTVDGGRELALSARPHAIVLDGQLGPEDGRALLPRLRDDLGYLPPVVFCTGGSPDGVEGVRAVIRKPFHAPELLELLETLTRA